MRVISLFAGIGGFDLGAWQSGNETVAAVEKDAQCRKLLAAKFPDAAILSDVCEAGFGNLPDCDMLCGGFPCQDLSVAGKRAGLAGARSGLFYEFTRIAYELQPAYILWENVPGLLSSNRGRDFLAVLTELRRIGYHGAWRTLDAQYFGVAQRRRRIFGLFARADIGAGRCAEILSLHEGMRGHPAPRREAGKEIAGTLGSRTEKGGMRTTDLDGHGAYICRPVAHAVVCHGAKGGDPTTDNYVAHTLRGEGFDASEDGTGRGTPLVTAYGTAGNCGPFEQGDKTGALNCATDPNQNIIATRSMVRRLTPRECERLQGFPTTIKRVIIHACFDHQKRNARVELQCLKSPSSASLAEGDARAEFAKSADVNFWNDQESRGSIVAVHVRQRETPKLQGIRSQGKWLWFASGAERQKWFHQHIQEGDFAHAIAAVVRGAEALAQGGKAESRQSTMPFIVQSNGSWFVERCGRENLEFASGAEVRFQRAMSIISGPAPNTLNDDLTRETWLCSAINVIVSFIPDGTPQGNSWKITADLEEDWTAGFSDLTRYRMLGNAVAVPVARWIFSRL